MDKELEMDVSFLHMFNELLISHSSLWVNIENNKMRNSSLIFSRRIEGVVVKIVVNNENVNFCKHSFLCSDLILDDSSKNADFYKASGIGFLVLHANGKIHTRVLGENEVVKLKKNSIVAMMDSVCSISTSDPYSNLLSGPGRIWLKSSDENINDIV